MPQTPKRRALIVYLVTALYAAMMFLSLKFRFLDFLLPGTWHGRIGFDFFSVPRSWINLLHGQSIYFTRGNDFGPYASWFPYHPAVSPLLGGWLSLFSPWVSFWIFSGLSFGALCCCGYLFSRLTENPVHKALAYFFMVCSPVVYLMLWAGQLHVLVVAAVALVLADLLELMDGKPARKFRLKLACGILISLFSKPIILPVLAALAIVPQYRRTIVYCAGAYAAVSFALWFVPFFNPRSVGLDRLVEVALHPEIMFRLELYRGVWISSYKPEYVFDNAIHWFNMKMRSDMGEPFNFELFSLTGFFSGFGFPAWFFKLPAWFALALCVPAYFVRKTASAFKLAFLGAGLLIMSFFLSYTIVYEYHYTVLLPLLAGSFILYHKTGDAVLKTALLVFCAAGALLYVPTAYFMVRNPVLVHHTAQTARFSDPFISIVLSENIYGYVLRQIRFMRVLPVMVMYGAFAFAMLAELKSGFSVGARDAS
ncbi:MAG: hypothetical protein WCS77_07975 [Elusimicrobiaceae bacterium]